MVERAGAVPGDAETSLEEPRAQFVGSLGRRLEALRQALFALEQTPKSAALRDHLRRRIHAFGAAAGVLGFERVFEAFREAETVLGRAGATGLGVSDLALVGRTIDLVPSLVLGAAAPSLRPLETSGSAPLERRAGSWPISALAFGSATLVASFNAAAPGGPVVEWERTEDTVRAEDLVRIISPDVVVIDADRPDAIQLTETLAYDPLLDPVRIVAIGSFDRPEAGARLAALGVARILSRPVSPDTLKHAVLEVAREQAAPPSRFEPLGDVSVEALAERLVHEFRRGLVESLKTKDCSVAVSLGEGTDVLAAVWASVARVRELVTLRSGGAIRFDATGPEGAIPLSPMMATERATGAGESRSAAGVDLGGRKIVVVDDDPSVVWFLSGLLRAAGAEVLEAHDGDRALALVRSEWPDLVVSDVLMPGLDGFGLCREIKRDVALGDVPVILLSWKEDLLQKMRELGADADGYLRKEATSSAVVQRVREVLLPRARVEARLATGEEVRGRLDGLTPRLVLELACRLGTNVRVTIRDAAYLYEACVRGGRLRTATRTTEEGRAESGERALAGLLGVRAGRFAVRRDDSPCASDWDTELRQLISKFVLTARAAQSLLAEPSRVARIDIEEAALSPYLAATPKAVGTIVRRLAEGAAPSELLATGTSSRLLESVLVDLVLHGAIGRISGIDGEDLLATEVAVLGALGAAEATAPAVDTARLGTDPGVAAPIVAPPEGASAPADADVGFAALLVDSLVPPSGPEPRRETPRPIFKSHAPPTSAPPEPSPLEEALRSVPSPMPSEVRASPRDAVEAVSERAPPTVVSEPPGPRVEHESAPVASAASEPVPEARQATSAPPRLAVDYTRVMPAISVPAAESGPEKPSTTAETPALELGDAVLSAVGGESPVAPEAVVAPASSGHASEESISTMPTVPPKRQRAALAGRVGGNKVGKPGPTAARQEDRKGFVGVFVVIIVAAVASYALVTAIRGGNDVARRSPSDVVPSTVPTAAPSGTPSALQVAAPPAVMSAAPPGAALHGVRWITKDDLDLPPGLSVAPDRGLLEIEAGGPYAIVVDGVPVGIGPIRQIPLAPGHHDVHVRGDGIDSTTGVEVRAGRRTHIGTTNAQ